MNFSVDDHHHLNDDNMTSAVKCVVTPKGTHHFVSTSKTPDMGGRHPPLDVYSFPAQTMGPPPNFYQPPPHPLDSYPHAAHVYSFPAQTMGPPPSFYQPPPHPLDSYPHAVQYHTPQCGSCGFCGVTTAFRPGAPPHLTFGTGGTTMGVSGSWGGGNAANGGVANALAHGGMGVPSNANAPDRVALASNHYGTNTANGFHHHQQQHHHQHPESGKTEGTADNRQLRNREHARRLRVRKRFMLDSLQQRVRELQDEHSTLRVLVQNAGVPLSPTVALSVLNDRSPNTPAVPALLVNTAALPDPVAVPTPDENVMEPHLNEGTADDQRLQKRRSRERKKFMLESLQQRVRELHDKNSTLRMLVQNVGVQTMIEPNAGAFALVDKVNATHPITDGSDDNEDDYDDDGND